MRGNADDGFTLPELLMAVTILALIIAPLTLAFVTALRVVGKTDQKFTDSRGALISAADFASDVNNANVITTGTSPAQCGSGGTRLVTFAWSDANQPVASLDSNTNRVTYYYDSTTDPSNKMLLRRICKNGSSTASKSVAAVSLGSQPTVQCFVPGAPGAALACNTATSPTIRWAKMAVTATPNSKTPDNPSPVAFSFTLAGTRRAK